VQPAPGELEQKRILSEKGKMRIVNYSFPTKTATRRILFQQKKIGDVGLW